jgi:hypothetical protein
MGVEADEGCELGEKASLCILKWTWLACVDAQEQGGAFLKKVHEIENTHDLVSLDDETMWEFFTALPDAVCNNIYKAFAQNPSRYEVDKIRTLWHRIFHMYEQKYDTASYLATCRGHLAENWRYGAPLIDDALESRDYKSAENFLEHTFSALLGEGGKNWLPETRLLIGASRFRYEPQEGNVMKLLETWVQVAEKRNLPARKAAVLFQAGTFRFQENWETVIGQYQFLSGPETQEVLDPLFDLWKKEMVSRSADYSFRAYDPKDNWVYWLIGAQAEGGAKNTEFLEKVKTWLARLSQNANAFKKGAKWLALFTKEVPGSDALAKEYPAFFQAAIPGGSSAESILSHSRQNALEKLDAGQCIPLAMRAWTRSLVSMVPDPSEARSGHYEAQALWMNALYELNPDDYRSLLANWQKTHKLKRNLWRDMKERSLPLDLKGVKSTPE